MFFKSLTITLLASIAAIAAHADGAYDPRIVSELKTAIHQELTQKFRQFNSPRIELGMIRLLSGKLPTTIKSVALQSENSRGEAQFAVYGQGDEVAEVVANYAAWIQVRVANRRITPGEHLSAEAFNTQEVNVATGLAYEQRGVLLSTKEDLSKLETRQSILEGQTLIANAVEKTPDVRRGDGVRIRVIAGDLNLSTLGTAAEPGYTNSTVKVLTSTTHRELTGILQPGGIVEVKL